jgi:hypothetical protein
VRRDIALEQNVSANLMHRREGERVSFTRFLSWAKHQGRILRLRCRILPLELLGLHVAGVVTLNTSSVPTQETPTLEFERESETFVGFEVSRTSMESHEKKTLVTGCHNLWFSLRWGAASWN